MGSGVDRDRDYRMGQLVMGTEQQRRCRDHAVHIGAVFDISVTAGNGVTEQPEI